MSRPQRVKINQTYPRPLPPWYSPLALSLRGPVVHAGAIGDGAGVLGRARQRGTGGCREFARPFERRVRRCESALRRGGSAGRGDPDRQHGVTGQNLGRWCGRTSRRARKWQPKTPRRGAARRTFLSSAASFGAPTSQHSSGPFHEKSRRGGLWRGRVSTFLLLGEKVVAERPDEGVLRGDLAEALRHDMTRCRSGTDNRKEWQSHNGSRVSGAPIRAHTCARGDVS